MRGEAAARGGQSACRGARNHKHDRHHRLVAMPETRPEPSLLFHLVCRQRFPGYWIHAVVIECIGERFLPRDGNEGIEGHMPIPSSM